MEALPYQKGPGNDLREHVRNFLDCMKSREKPNADIAIAANTAKVAHMGNVAYKVGQKVYWDKTNNQFVDNDKANELAKVSYRKPWKLPKY